jgi:FKBP-type peptidyl-prolyl cis-trans isomerase
MNWTRNLTLALTGLLASSYAACQDPAEQGGIPECEQMEETSSGLQWGILTPGTDAAGPADGDTVEVHYTGWLTDGKKFDSSRDRGAPSKFGVNQVIPGWTEGLKLMTPGMRCKFVIPGDLAYGAQGRPGTIPPNATLVFDVELISVVRMPKMPPADAAKQKALEDGCKVQVMKVGAGAAIGADDGVALRYAIWKADGTLLDCTEKSGRKMSGALDSLQWPFLKGVVADMKVGGVVRAEVPQALLPQARADTVWELELVSTTKLPKFRDLAQDKVVTTQSGLQYEVIDQGEGDSPKATDTVVAHYSGWLTDGTMFDSSHARGEPTEFPLNRVIAGWTEGLQLMKPGGKFLFRIPSELGYGSRQSGQIPPNSTLVFLVELVEVK